MTTAPGRRDRRHRRARRLARRAATAAPLVALVVIGVAVTTSGTASAKEKPSYCAEVRAFDAYRGDRAATVRTLLSRALQVAPVDIAPTIRTMRALHEPSPQFDAAKAAWSRYNTNNCCTCLGGPNAPHVLVGTDH